MFDISPLALAAAFLWIALCVVWSVILTRRKPQSVGLDRFQRGLLLAGIIQLALAPIYCVVHYVLSNHQAWWAGAWAIVPGLLMIGWSSLFRRWKAAVDRRSTAMTFREMSIAAQIAAIALVYTFYGVQLCGVSVTPVTAVATLVGITMLMILISIVAHITIALYAGPERSDERDRVVTLRGTRNAYHALAAGVWCVLLLAIAHTPYGLLFYAIMGAFAFAELVRLSSQLIYYRLGV
jgi:hypothetical protein